MKSIVQSEYITENREAVNLQTIPSRLQWWVVLLWKWYPRGQESLFHTTSEPECYPRVLSQANKGQKGIFGTNRNFAAKYGSVQLMEKDGEKYCKTCYGCQLVALQGLSEPKRFHLGEFWLLICSDHFPLTRPFQSLWTTIVATMR